MHRYRYLVLQTFVCLFSQATVILAVFRIRILLNPDPDLAKNLNPDPDPEDLESGSGSKLFLNTI